MDDAQFDDLIQSLASSRRSVLSGSVAAIGAWLGATGADARKKRHHKRHKRRKKKPQFNKFGCVDVGGKCFGDDANCCSGICEGTGKTSRCAAHNELGCPADDDTCSESVPCGGTGVCYRTTGKAAFCGDFRVCNCLPCRTDADCELDFGPGAACVTCDADCNGVNHSQGTACVPAAA
jgi:hypothetical protein